MLFASANCELKTTLMSSTEKTGGSASMSEDDQLIVLVAFPIMFGWSIVMVARTDEATARAARNTFVNANIVGF